MNTSFDQTIDPSAEYDKPHNEFYLPSEVIGFNTNENSGFLKWRKHGLEPEYVFNKTGLKLVKKGGKEVFQDDYEINPTLHWSVTFISKRSIRLEMQSSKVTQKRQPTIMLNGKIGSLKWETKTFGNHLKYKSDYVTLSLNTCSWEIKLHDKAGKEIFKTLSLKDSRAMHQKYVPFSFIRNTKTHQKTFAFSTSLSHNERLYGCGESFTGLNKRGQRINLFTTDAQSALTQEMYKPIPFFFSTEGYGIFVHSSAPMTFDFGYTHNATSTLFINDELLDVFIFTGTIKEILEEYTLVTGRSSCPPIWSYGLWMSRLSYKSQKEVEEVAIKLRENRIPADVIHIDAGWFENYLHCDYEFGKYFEDPEQMISRLDGLGFKISLWQMTYYNSKNRIYDEIIAQNLYVKESNGLREDVILDFSNPEAIKWYANKINYLIKLGVSAIKADFGERAPVYGNYHSNQSGTYEHNLYPLRYAKALNNILKDNSEDKLIWTRSAWAGSQRYPVHWSGDPEVSNEAMASTLRAGLSLGLSGFTFWSHDIGGFSKEPDPDLFLRWTFMGIFSSHSRVHGIPPREPWHFGDEFLTNFRSLIEVKYKLMPYILSEAKICAEKGFPLLRPLFFDFGNDLNTWQIEDEYMFGENMLIAPFFESDSKGRRLYLPHGDWFDYFTNRHYKGGDWFEIESEKYGVALVKSGSCIPHVKLSQSISLIDWSQITLKIFTKYETKIISNFYHPFTQRLMFLEILKNDKNVWEPSIIYDNIQFKIQLIN